MTRRSVSAEERIFSLILALIASPNGASRDELLSSVHGYAQEYTPGGPNASLERKFERDKADIRTLGIPLETIDSPLEPGNNQLARYRIRKSMLEVPSDISFTSEEASLIRAAALAWSEGSLTQDSRRAMMKLQARTATVDTSLIGVAPSLRLAEPAESAFRAAIRAGQAVEFDYRKPGDDRPTRRRVTPLRLHQADGRWHLIAFDHVREAHRVFLLSRVSGRIVERAGAVEVEAHAAAVEHLIEELELIRTRQVARLRVEPGSRAEARLRPRSTAPNERGTQLLMHTLDFAELAGELLAFGRDVQIEGPRALLDHYEALVQSIARSHSTSSEGTP